MNYVLPRIVFVLIAWAMTCVLIRNLWPAADLAVFAALGVIWALGGVGYFGYLQKLRRDIEELERRRYALRQQRGLPSAESSAAE